MIAARLCESKYNIPHYYITVKLRVDNLIKLREQVNKISDDKISLNDFFIKAVALTSREIPESRSFWDGDNERIRISEDIGISFAVDTGKGLITPIVHHADKISISKIQKKTKQLIDKAKQNKLSPNEYIVKLY